MKTSSRGSSSTRRGNKWRSRCSSKKSLPSSASHSSAKKASCLPGNASRTPMLSKDSIVEQIHLQSKQGTTVQSEQQPENPNSFRPEISKKSKNIKRDKPVQEYLFEDAKKRQDMLLLTVAQLEHQQTISQVGPTDDSAEWFVQRFIKDFYYQLSNLERIKQTEQKDYSRLTYTETLSVLVGLSMLKEVRETAGCPQLKVLSSIWRQLTVGNAPTPSILSRNLLVFLLAILNVPYGHIQIPFYKPSVVHEDSQLGLSDELFQQQVQDLVKDVGGGQTHTFDEAGNLILSEEGVGTLHSAFRELYYNVRLQKGNGQRRQSKLVFPEEPFSPKLSKRTNELSQKKKNGTSLNEWFEGKQKEKEERLNNLKQEAVGQTMKECKFQRVKQMTIDLKQLARPLAKREDKTTVDAEFEHQAEHCTFQPQISGFGKKPSTGGKVDEHIVKTSERLKEARVRKEAVKQMQKKGFTTNNKIRSQVKKDTEEQEAGKINRKLRSQKSQPMFTGSGIQSVVTESNEQLLQGQEEPSQSKHEEEVAKPMEDGQEKQVVEIIEKFDLGGGQDEEKVPLLFVDVNIEEGRTARIVVYEGDKSEDLAEKFSLEYAGKGLDESMKTKLKELLDLQINSLLTKIEEENELESDREQE